MLFCIDFVSALPNNTFTLTSDRGFISSLDFPSPYAPDAEQRWIIEAPADHVISLTFYEFVTEAPDDNGKPTDWLRVSILQLEAKLFHFGEIAISSIRRFIKR